MCFIQLALYLCHQGAFRRLAWLFWTLVNSVLAELVSICVEQELGASVISLRHPAGYKQALLCQPYCPSVGTIPGQPQPASCHQNNPLPFHCLLPLVPGGVSVPPFPTLPISPGQHPLLSSCLLPLHELALSRFAISMGMQQNRPCTSFLWP